MTPTDVHEKLKLWSDLGWLREIDRVFAGFLGQLDPTAPAELLLAAALTSHQLGRGHVCMDLNLTLTDPGGSLALPPLELKETIDPADRPAELLGHLDSQSWCDTLHGSPLVAQGAGNSPLVLDGTRLYLRRYWQYELEVVMAIRQRLAQATPLPADLASRLNRLFSESSATPDLQKIACALATRSAFTVITGGPGTGKTRTVVNLLALLQSAALDNGKPLRIRLAAPTGKAAARLTESISQALSQLPEDMHTAIPTEAGTLHRLLGATPNSRRFRHDRHHPILADLVIVDEASMIDLEMMAALLAALRPSTRLVLLGDKDQLASVDAGSVLGDLCRNVGAASYSPALSHWLTEMTGETLATATDSPSPLSQHIVQLNISYRFGANSGIGQLARAVNAGDVSAAWNCLKQNSTAYPDLSLIERAVGDDPLQAHFDSHEISHLRPSSAAPSHGHGYYLAELREHRPQPESDPPLSERYDTWAKNVLAAFSRFQILCALRQGPFGVEGVNRLVEQALKRQQLIDPSRVWYEGRPVLVMRNDYSLGLMNGDIGITLYRPDDASTNRLRVAFLMPDQSIRWVLPSRLHAVETAYAMTVHKSQGSEFGHVGLILPNHDSPIMTRELLYTAITRAKTHCTLFCPKRAVLDHAIKTPVQRIAGLAQRLQTER